MNYYLILEVRTTPRGPRIFVSRTHPDLVKRLFEEEVPEIRDGVVEVKSIAREPGSRTKIAVWSNDPNVDPVGACVGKNGARVDAVVNDLKGEKIDIITWDEDPARLIENALSPSSVISVDVNYDEKSARVVVPDYQLSLAIGKEGQNARLAAKLTGYKIDIKSESQAAELAEMEDYDRDRDYDDRYDEDYDDRYDDDYDDRYDDEYDEDYDDRYDDDYDEDYDDRYDEEYRDGDEEYYEEDSREEYVEE